MLDLEFLTIKTDGALARLCRRFHDAYALRQARYSCRKDHMWYKRIRYSWYHIKQMLLPHAKTLLWPLEIGTAFLDFTDPGKDASKVYYTWLPCDAPVSEDTVNTLRKDDKERQSFFHCRRDVHRLPYQTACTGAHHPVTAFMTLYELWAANGITQVHIKGNEDELKHIKRWFYFANRDRPKLPLIFTASGADTDMAKPEKFPIADLHVLGEQLLTDTNPQGHFHHIAGDLEDTTTPRRVEDMMHCAAFETAWYATTETLGAPRRDPEVIGHENVVKVQYIYLNRLLNATKQEWPEVHGQTLTETSYNAIQDISPSTPYDFDLADHFDTVVNPRARELSEGNFREWEEDPTVVDPPDWGVYDSEINARG